jgi:3'-phosphoadenosine 5'-phosphosulfate sulfotransferase (PAPS reductase)/FAD synthetase
MKLMTRLAKEQITAYGNRPVFILNCLGMRKEESPARGRLAAFERDLRASSGRRVVDRWLPIHEWSTARVWESIRASGVPHHPAYDLGMPRLSCSFCIFAPPAALLLAGRHRPELLGEYVSIEDEIGHTFRHKFSLRVIQAEFAAGVDGDPVEDWAM